MNEETQGAETVSAFKRYRVSVGYEGENIKRDVWYSLNEVGDFVEVES